MAGDGFSGLGACAAGDKLSNPLGALFPASDFNERAYDGPDHIPEEAVGAHPEVPVVIPSCRARLKAQGQVCPGPVATLGRVRGRGPSLLGRGRQSRRSGVYLVPEPQTIRPRLVNRLEAGLTHDGNMRRGVRCPEGFGDCA